MDNLNKKSLNLILKGRNPVNGFFGPLFSNSGFKKDFWENFCRKKIKK